MGPVYIIDDDLDDQEFILEIFEELQIKNKLFFFNSSREVLIHLKTVETTPFLILCDVNIPQMDGYELRRNLLEDKKLVYKTIPFIFWSNVASNNQIKKAFDLSVHGFFIKGKNYEELKNSLKIIFAYWQESQHPGN